MHTSMMNGMQPENDSLRDFLCACYEMDDELRSTSPSLGMSSEVGGRGAPSAHLAERAFDYSCRTIGPFNHKSRDHGCAQAGDQSDHDHAVGAAGFDTFDEPPRSDRDAQRDFLERSAGRPMSQNAADCMLLSPMAFALERIPRRGPFGPSQAVAWRAIRVLEAVAVPGNMDRELAYVVEWCARVVAGTMASCEDDDAAGAAAAFAVLGALEATLVLDRLAAPRQSPRFARAPPVSGQAGFYAAFLETVRESTNCATFFMTNEVQGASGTERRFSLSWAVGVATLGFMVRSLRDPALGDQVSGYEPAFAVTDAPLPSVDFGTFDVSHVASSVAACCRKAILHNSPLNIARAIKTGCAERCAIECRARKTDSIVSGWLTPAPYNFGGNRVINLVQYNCHDPATNRTYSARISEIVDRSGKPVGGARWHY